MNWDAAGAIAEILGAGGVIVSLIYLATQIRNQNKESRLAAMHDISVGFREVTAKFATPDMSEIWARSVDSYDDLTDAETTRFLILAGGVFRAWEEAYIQHDEGTLDARSWDAMVKYYSTIYSHPGLQRAWSLRSKNFDTKFQQFVNGLEVADYKIR